MFTTLISAGELADLPEAERVVLDCRFQLSDPDHGHHAYNKGHIPGAYYLNLDYHLSGAKTGRNGRHPLPEGQRLAVKLGACGVQPGKQVVVYDDTGGMFAARAWWLLRWLGHEAVAVLDGGLPAWLASGGELTHATPRRQTRRYISHPALTQAVKVDVVVANLRSPSFVLVDARSPERFRGEGETLDPVGGHIPGALNHFFMRNLDEGGRFKDKDRLKQEWIALLGEHDDWSEVVHQCGSGVTACVNLLAMEHAGLTGSRLYPGSWSEWCSDPARPVER
jgi:thiosulfate/3-mercaptopyruvate sulfurtransferase